MNNLKKKINNFYTKKRSGWLFDFSDWVLTDPRALSVTLFLGSVLTTSVFSFIAITWYMMAGFHILTVIFGILAILSIPKTIKMIKLAKYYGGIDKIIDVNANEMLWSGKYGNDGKHQDYEDGPQFNAGKDQGFREGISKDNQESESNDISFSDLIQSDSNSSPQSNNRRN